MKKFYEEPWYEVMDIRSDDDILSVSTEDGMDAEGDYIEAGLD